MTDQDSTSAVDETPISPVNRPDHIRKNSLEKHLQRRPDAQDLKDRNILLDTSVAPSLQSAAVELQRQQATDSLRKGLEKRPQREDLVERNILPDSTAAPGIVGQQKELEKHMRADSLNEKISHRPTPAELIKEGVLREDPTSPTEDPDKLYEERIEEEYAKREGGA